MQNFGKSQVNAKPQNICKPKKKRKKKEMKKNLHTKPQSFLGKCSKLTFWHHHVIISKAKSQSYAMIKPCQVSKLA